MMMASDKTRMSNTATKLIVKIVVRTINSGLILVTAEKAAPTMPPMIDGSITKSNWNILIKGSINVKSVSFLKIDFTRTYAYFTIQ